MGGWLMGFLEELWVLLSELFCGEFGGVSDICYVSPLPPRSPLHLLMAGTSFLYPSSRFHSCYHAMARAWPSLSLKPMIHKKRKYAVFVFQRVTSLAIPDRWVI